VIQPEIIPRPQLQESSVNVPRSHTNGPLIGEVEPKLHVSVGGPVPVHEKEALEFQQSSDLLGFPSNSAGPIPPSKTFDSSLSRRQTSRIISPSVVPVRESSLPATRSTLSPRSKDPPTSGNDAPLNRSPIKPGSTKWPLLDITSPSTPSPVLETYGGEAQHIITTVESEDDAFHATKSVDTYHTSLSQQAFRNSPSVRSVSGSSSGARETEQYGNSSTRVKRLSTHTLNLGLGPILTIAGDADAVLFGSRDSVPEVPPILDAVSAQSSEERSPSAIAGKTSRQTINKISLTKTLRSITPRLSDTEPSGGAPTRIVPIRSMKQPRGMSAESSLNISDAPASQLPATLSSAREGALRHSQTLELLESESAYKSLGQSCKEQEFLKAENKARSQSPPIGRSPC